MDNPIVIDASEVESRSFITKVYGWMCLGLAITGWISGVIGTNATYLQFLLANRVLFYGLILGEFILVIAMAGWIQKMTVAAATMAFLAYSAFNGVTLAPIFAIYTSASIASTFFVTAGMFGAMSFYGFTTKTDLSTIGNICFMGLIGIILASIVNFWFKNPTIYWVVTYLSILIFTGLTAYDTQKLKRMNIIGNAGTDEDKKEAILGALTLYLDFLNLFLSLLRVLGKRR